MKKLLFMGIIMMSLTSFAQDVDVKEELQGEASESLASVRLANELLRYGYRNNSTLALIDALQILSENPTQKLNATREEEAVDKPAVGEKSTQVSFDYETVLADAKKFADGDANLLAIIDNIDAEAKGAQRGSVNGPSIHYDRVRAYGTDTYTISFVAGYLAEIGVSGDGDTDLDLYVYDSNGNLIARDADYTDDCYVTWVPRWTGKYYVKIINRGPLYNNYVIATN